MICGRCGTWCAVLLLLTSNAFAQSRPRLRIPSRELDVGIAWIGRATFGPSNANLTTGSGGTQPLFSTSSETAPGVALEAHLGYRLSNHFRAELSGAWLRTELRTRITTDFENADPVDAAMPIWSFSVEGAGVWSFRPGKPFEPFLRAGGGWLRELTEDKVLVADGSVANVGAGVKYWWRQRAGLRTEVRATIRSGGLELAGHARRVSPGITASAAFRF